MSSRRVALRALAPVYASVFLFTAGMSSLQILVPVYLSRAGELGPAAIGTIIGVFGIASLAARLPVGLAYSTRRSTAFLIAGGGLSALAFALIPLTENALVLTALMALNGLGWSIASTSQLALLVARPPGGVSTAVAMGWFAGATAFGNIAAVLGGLSADTIGLRPTFFALAATPLVAAVLMVRGVAASAVVRRDEPERPLERTRLWRSLAGMPLAVWVGVLVMFFINALNALTNTFHPVLALASGLTLTQIAALSSTRSWASSSSRFGSGPLFSRFDPAGLTLPLVVLGTIATAFIPSVRTSFLLQLPLFALAGVSRGLLRVTGSADAFDSAAGDERRHGLIAALLYGGLDVGKIVGPVVGGVVAGIWGIATMFQVVPVAFLLLYLALAVPARRAVATA
ncbi:MAG TPA: MFS transporter [Gaiellaceae bacterium]|nr:MFS transporter [Gaiellaceae bacterium]